MDASYKNKLFFLAKKAVFLNFNLKFDAPNRHLLAVLDLFVYR